MLAEGASTMPPVARLAGCTPQMGATTHAAYGPLRDPAHHAWRRRAGRYLEAPMASSVMLHAWRSAGDGWRRRVELPLERRSLGTRMLAAVVVGWVPLALLAGVGSLL